MRSDESVIRLARLHRKAVRDLCRLARELGGLSEVEVLRLAILVGEEVERALKSEQPSDREN
jgi:hypothetical protein